MYAEGEKDCEEFFSEILSSSLGMYKSKVSVSVWWRTLLRGIMTCKLGDYNLFLLNQSS